MVTQQAKAVELLDVMNWFLLYFFILFSIILYFHILFFFFVKHIN